MDRDPSLEFDFYLAERLHMTVAELRERLSSAEWTQWYVYYGRKAQRIELEQKRRS